MMCSLRIEAWGRAWNIPIRIAIPDPRPDDAERPGLLRETGPFACYLRLALDQPRVRERIMKLSKVYSATCHHRYWSER
jgi:hypothetical protein